MSPSATPTPLQSASVLVAGGSGGLGRVLATELHRRGAELTLVARDETRLAAVPEPARRISLDLRLPGACEQAITEATAGAGRLDVVINAVGVVAFGPATELSVDVMEELFLTNTFVSMMLTSTALKELHEGGVIVNISGVIAERNLPGMAAYGASKAAVRAFDDAVAREARRAGVRIVDARPPHTETGLAERPIAGEAPKMPTGLDPARVATVICDAIEHGATDIPSTDF